MHLITMAHLGEAQGVINKFQLAKITPELFKNEELVLLLTGEGPFEAATKTALIIPRHPFTEIINLGIAGALKEASVGEIYPVRTFYLIQDQRPSFKSFQPHQEGLDCLTSFERILDPIKASSLKGMGQLVDREGWGVAYAAKTAGLPFKSFKLVSDMAGTINACEIIKEEAYEFSLKIADYLEHYLGNKNLSRPEERTLLSGFHFTFSTHHQFKNLLNKLSIKEEVAEAEILKTLPLEQLKEHAITPKERARKLIELMENQIDPFKGLLRQKKHELQKTFQDKGLKLDIDPQWENERLTISFEAASDEEKNQKLTILKELSISSFTELMNGKIHVE